VSERRLKILFVCLGNACRSPMAEALANHLGKDRVQAWSAGSHPLGEITEETRTVLEEIDISIDSQCSKGLGDVSLEQMDVVVTMGEEVECPLPADFKGKLIEWKIPDPFRMDLEFFRSVRDLIEARVKLLLDQLELESRPSDSKV